MKYEGSAYEKSSGTLHNKPLNISISVLKMRMRIKIYFKRL